MAKISIQVVYASPQQSLILECEILEGSTVLEAIQVSGLLQKVPDWHPGEGLVGIYGRKVSLKQVLSAGDRIECYRPITADPKVVRRKRV